MVSTVAKWLVHNWPISFMGVMALVLGMNGKTQWNKGYAAGEHAATEKVQAADLEHLQAVIDSTRALTAAANEASRKLNTTIGARQQADAKATKEIRDALAATASRRTGCVFDAGVMQQLEAARERAAAAAAGGLHDAVPGTD